MPGQMVNGLITAGKEGGASVEAGYGPLGHLFRVFWAGEGRGGGYALRLPIRASASCFACSRILSGGHSGCSCRRYAHCSV